jgi:thioredoxin-like negative regulator of GroEL
LIQAESVSVLQLDVALRAVVAPHLLDVAVVTSLLARMTVETETETMSVETATDLAVQMTGKNHVPMLWPNLLTILSRDRDIKDDRDRDREEIRENGTNGEDRKGEFELPSRTKN